MSADQPGASSIAAWLSVADATAALAFYRTAFAAVTEYRFDADDGRVAVARLRVGAAEFWIAQDDSPDLDDRARPVRMIMTVPDPDACFAQALAAGAAEVYPVTEAHGWRTGRITDPFGHDWEFSRPIGQ